jgi:hypothetical protein
VRSGYPRSAPVDGNESLLAQPRKISRLGEQHDSGQYPPLVAVMQLFNVFNRKWRQSFV